MASQSEQSPAPFAPSEPGPIAVPPLPASAVGRGPRGALIAAVALIAVLAGSALFVSGYTLGAHAALTPGTPANESQAFQPFWDTYRAVTDRYAGGKVDHKILIEGAIKGMIAALGDPYSQYLTSDEFKASLRGISGEFEGIGAELGTVDAAGRTTSCDKIAPDCRLAVEKPLVDSPADHAGLLPGDVITAIDGRNLTGLTVDVARDRIRGPKDTIVRLTIARGERKPFELQVVRAVIIQQEVESRDLAGGAVGYIRLTGFSDHAAKDFETVTTAEVAAGKTKLILDLRGNPGGFVTAARTIASQFIGSGTIFWQQDANGTLTETVAQPDGAATDPKIKLVVLVDGGSASASEIVAAALQERGRAQLIGSKTFGKGTVQQWTQLENDSGGFRLTIAKWLTPDRHWIHGVGIEPDIAVTATASKPGEDPVLDKALQVLGAPATGSLRWAA